MTSSGLYLENDLVGPFSPFAGDTTGHDKLFRISCLGSLLSKIGFQADCQEESPYASCPSAARWLCFASARLVPAKSATGILYGIRHLLPTIRRTGGWKTRVLHGAVYQARKTRPKARNPIILDSSVSITLRTRSCQPERVR